MNEERRKKIREMFSRFEQMSAALEDLQCETEYVREEEEDYLRVMPESIVEGARGEAAGAAIEALIGAYDAFCSMEQTLQEAREYLQEALA